MKRLFFAIICLFCITSIAYAYGSTKIENTRGVDVTNTSTSVFSDNTLIKTGDGALYNVQVTGKDTVAGDIIDLYDDVTSVGATKIWGTILSGNDEPIEFSCPNGVIINTGIYADTTLSGGLTTASVVVAYK